MTYNDARQQTTVLCHFAAIFVPIAVSDLLTQGDIKNSIYRLAYCWQTVVIETGASLPYINSQLHQQSATPTASYTNSQLHQQPATPTVSYTNSQLHQQSAKPTASYTNSQLNQQSAKPTVSYTKSQLHQQPATPTVSYTNSQLTVPDRR